MKRTKTAVNSSSQVGEPIEEALSSLLDPGPSSYKTCRGCVEVGDEISLILDPLPIRPIETDLQGCTKINMETTFTLSSTDDTTSASSPNLSASPQYGFSLFLYSPTFAPSILNLSNKPKRLKMKKSVAIMILLLFCGLPGFSQTMLSLKAAVRYALENKAEAVKAGLDVENSAYQIEEVRSNALPHISAQGGVTYNALLQQMALTMGGETTVIEMGRPWQSTATVQLDQQIFNMAVFQGLKAAKTTQEFYQINKDLTEEQVIEKVAQNYFQVFKIQSQITTVEKTLKNTTRVRDVLAGLYENGLAKKIDLDRMNVSLNNLSSERQHLINALSLQKNSLKFLIGMDINKKIQLPDNTFTVNSGLALNNPADLNQLTEIQLLKKQSELLHYNKKAIAAKRYPTLSFTANYGYSGLGEKLPYFKGSNQGVNWSNYAALGLNLSIPLFTGFNNRAKIQQAQIEIEKNKVDIADTRLALSLAQKNAQIQIKNSLITLRSQQENTQLAKDVMQNVENNYKNGLATLTDLLDAENAYADAQNSYTNALMDYKLAEIQLVKSQGRLSTYYTK